MKNIYEDLDTSSWKSGWEPGAPVFTGYENEVLAIEQKYPARNIAPADVPVSGTVPATVFYGASNFRMWKNLDRDMAQFGAQNHGFGGATDVLLVHYADRLLFPYAPDVAVIQSGSNDYAGLKGKPARQAAANLELKIRMYGYFLEHLPDTRFVLLSPLLMPGAPYFTETSLLVAEGMEKLCEELPRLTFAGVSDLTFDGTAYRTDLFKSDGIHLNRDGQLALRERITEVLYGVFKNIGG
ncbi:MAG: hypothetical protein J5535_02440 [Firmicutes bacterium]|nr:hypothetical protein [Bacillota bacterium]